MIRPEGNITLGGSMDGGNKFSGYLHSLKFYDKPLTESELQQEYDAKSDTQDRLQFYTDDLHFHANAVSPDYIQMQIYNSQGIPIKTGLFTTTYKVEKGTKKNTKLCTAYISDDEGPVLTLTQTVSVDPKQFTELAHKEATRLSTSSADFNEDPVHNGANIFEEVEGDFVVQCRVNDLEGVKSHNVPAYNEAGIILLEGHGDFIQNGVFPLYNCGNMLTHYHRGRPQYPVQNGYDYDPYLQLQRVGNLVYARRSADGISWTDMPGSPIRISAPKVQLGIYQTTYTDTQSWAELSDFVIYQNK